MKKAIPLPLIRSYNTCTCGRYLYLDASLTSCPECQAERATSVSRSPVRVISIADKIAELLICDEFREGMRDYAEIVRDYQQQESGRAVYRDVFDGEIYQKLLNDGVFDQSIMNIILKLDVDGFTCSSSKESMVMVNAVILSLDPSERYAR